jgi:hypothetical protein
MAWVVVQLAQRSATASAKRLASPPLFACKMRANRSTPTGNRRTAQHEEWALTWENTTNHRPTTQVVTGQVLLLICGFGVQVPGGALCLTWPYAASGPLAEDTS